MIHPSDIHKDHTTRLTVDLTALVHNVNVYKSLLRSDTEIIAVVKADAYGSGAEVIASTLVEAGVSNLAVAFISEAIILRNHGIAVPIIVLNAGTTNLDKLIAYDLDIEIYCLEQLSAIKIVADLAQKPINMHLKIDSGMHRLGFIREDIVELVEILKNNSLLRVSSIFSHLACSECEIEDEFSEGQILEYDKMYDDICTQLDIRPQKHILNSGGISRLAQHQYDMVRLGIGMYGMDSVFRDRLQKVHRLTSTLLQIKSLKIGDSIGYNRMTRLEKDTKVGVVNIGYADGLFRCLGNRNYAVSIDGSYADIIGNISMDLIIVDLSQVETATVGMTVVIFDKSHPIESLASAAGTISYEVLTRIANRVPRVYV